MERRPVNALQLDLDANPIAGTLAVVPVPQRNTGARQQTTLPSSITEHHSGVPDASTGGDYNSTLADAVADRVQKQLAEAVRVALTPLLEAHREGLLQTLHCLVAELRLQVQRADMRPDELMQRHELPEAGPSHTATVHSDPLKNTRSSSPPRLNAHAFASDPPKRVVKCDSAAPQNPSAAITPGLRHTRARNCLGERVKMKTACGVRELEDARASALLALLVDEEEGRARQHRQDHSKACSSNEMAATRSLSLLPPLRLGQPVLSIGGCSADKPASGQEVRQGCSKQDVFTDSLAISSSEMQQQAEQVRMLAREMQERDVDVPRQQDRGSVERRASPALSGCSGECAGTKCFTVSVDRTPKGLMLGIDVELHRGVELLVTSVFENGLIASWNLANPSGQLLVGDRITMVNGHTTKLVEQLAAYTLLQITVHRGDPPETDAKPQAQEACSELEQQHLPHQPQQHQQQEQQQKQEQQQEQQQKQQQQQQQQQLVQPRTSPATSRHRRVVRQQSKGLLPQGALEFDEHRSVVSSGPEGPAQTFDDLMSLSERSSEEEDAISCMPQRRIFMTDMSIASSNSKLRTKRRSEASSSTRCSQVVRSPSPKPVPVVPHGMMNVTSEVSSLDAAKKHSVPFSSRPESAQLRIDHEAELLKNMVQDTVAVCSEQEYFSEASSAPPPVSASVEQHLRSPLWMRSLGVLPWEWEGECLRRTSRTYSRAIILVAVLAVAACILNFYLAHRKASEASAPFPFYLLCDLALAIGSFLGLLAGQRSLLDCELVGRSGSVLVVYARRQGIMQGWFRVSRRISWLLLVLWLCSLALRGVAALRLAATFWWDVVGFVVYAFTSAAFLALTYSILHMSCAITLIVDAYCVQCWKKLNLSQSVHEWNIFQSMLRMVSRSVEAIFLVLQTTALIGLLLGASDVVFNSGEIHFWWLSSTAVLTLGVLLTFFKAADVTEVCARVPSFINSLVYGNKNIDNARHYLVQYVTYTAAGFYVGEVRLNGATAVKLTYTAGLAAFAILTKAAADI